MENHGISVEFYMILNYERYKLISQNDRIFDVEIQIFKRFEAHILMIKQQKAY